MLFHFQETASLDYHNFRCLSTIFFNFLKVFIVERRRRDLNPRAATNDLLPFQGSPFSHLGTSPKAKSKKYLVCVYNYDFRITVIQLFQTENVGFEPTVPFGITGFQDQLLKPLGQLSEQRSLIITLIF